MTKEDLLMMEERHACTPSLCWLNLHGLMYRAIWEGAQSASVRHKEQ